MGSNQSKPEAKEAPPSTPKRPVESYLGISRASETGWDRVKSLFIFNKHLPEEYDDIFRVVISASFLGFLFGGMIGSRQMADKFIMLNQHSKFSSVMQAQRELHSAATLGFTSRGLKWAWKMGTFAGALITTGTLLQAYRDKDDPLNYIAAAGFVGGMYRINWGFLPFLGGTTLGLLCAIPPCTMLFIVEKLLLSKEDKFEAREKLFIARCERRNYRKLTEIKELAILEGIAEGELVDHFKTVPKQEKRWWQWKWFIWKQDKEFQKVKEKKMNPPKDF